MCMLCESLADAGRPEDDEILEAVVRDELKDRHLSDDEVQFNLEAMRDAGFFRPPYPG